MTEVDYYKLERAVQDRFADATRAIGVPVPLLRIPPRDRAHFVWFAVGAIIVVLATVSATLGVGDLGNPIALAPTWVLGAFAAAYAAGAFCLLLGFAAYHRATSRPYVRGLYLFPIGVVDARAEPFRVARLPDMKAVEVVGGTTLRVDFESGAPVLFPVADASTAGDLKRALDDARRSYDHAMATQNRRELASLDPLVDSGFTSPFSPKFSLRRQMPAWQRLSLPIALATGAALGTGVWIARNRVSERLLYERARDADTVSAYREYLARGGPRAEVAEVFLPRAELRLAQKTGSVEAIEAFATRNPRSRIGPEVTAALHTALDEELTQAKEKGSVSALRAFHQRRRKYDHIDAPTRAAIGALYDKALASYVAVSSPQHPEGRALVERLLAHAREHGPEVKLQFIRRTPSSVAEADAVVRRSAYFMGNASVPSQYFEADSALRRENEFLPEVVKRLQEPFPKDILTFSVVEALTVAEEQEPFPEAKAPTLFILSEAHMSGGYMSRKPRGVFVGVGMKFFARFVIPGETEHLGLESSTWRAPNPNLLKEDGAKIGDVYEVMAKHGYERFQRKLLETFFAKP